MDQTIRETAMMVLLFIVFGAPALAIATRIAVRPLVEAVVLLREAFTGSGMVRGSPPSRPR
jgi:hypothetical protein